MILGLKTRQLRAQDWAQCLATRRATRLASWTAWLWAGLLTFSALPVMWGQPGEDSYQRIDGIVAVVGDEIVLASDIRERVVQAQMEGNVVTDAQTCSLLESILFEKLLVHNARLDSLDVSEAEVMGEIDRRLTYYLQMFGTLEAFEAEYGKSVAEWKADFQEPVWEQLMAQKMQAEIDQSVRSTPAQVQAYFESLSVDSLPLIPEELSYSELVLQPEVGERQKLRTRNTLDSIRTLVVTGKMSMTLAATRYSEDPGSKYKGGCYNNIARGQFVPEFEGAVYGTDIGDYSPVFESDFGYHFLRVTDRRGQQFSACHVLMKPTFDPSALVAMQAKSDSVSLELAKGEKTFEQAVLAYSTREATRNQKGQVVNPRDGGNRFGVDELDPTMYFLLQDLREGEVSAPVQLYDEDQQAYWAMLRLDRRHPAHRANPQDDYAMFQQQVEADLRQEALMRWVNRRIGETYVRIDAPHKGCTMEMPWLSGSINARAIETGGRKDRSDPPDDGR